MAKYYAIERSSEYLEHYGVKGMRWGVRKAIASGNSKKLARQYAKASKKLNKLESRANISKQKQIEAKSNKVAKRALGVGIAGLNASMGGKLLSLHLLNKAADSSNYARWNREKKDSVVGELAKKRDRVIQENLDLLKDPNNYKDIGLEEATRRTNSWNENIVKKYYNKDIDAETKYYNDQINGWTKDFNNQYNGAKISDTVHKVAGGIGAASLGVAAGAKIRSGVAKYRAGSKGHAKAVAKRDAWKQEMNKAFAGTKYAKKRRK